MPFTDMYRKQVETAWVDGAKVALVWNQRPIG